MRICPCIGRAIFGGSCRFVGVGGFGFRWLLVQVFMGVSGYGCKWLHMRLDMGGGG